MANSKNDDMDRSGDRSTPQGSTPQMPQNTPQGRDPMNRDRDFEEGRNITNQDWKSPNPDSEKNDERGPTDIEE